MMFTQALPIFKSKLGITSTVRDEYLLAILQGIEEELTSIQGITLDETNTVHLMFVIDYAEYRYNNRDNPTLPRHLQWRLHNLMLKGGGPNV